MASEGWFPLCFFSSLCCKSDTFPGGKNEMTNVPPNPDEKCVFPFKWMGVEHIACTKANHDQFWCGTRYNIDIDIAQDQWNITGWGHCVDSDVCPKEGQGW